MNILVFEYELVKIDYIDLIHNIIYETNASWDKDKLILENYYQMQSPGLYHYNLPVFTETIPFQIHSINLN